jgi:hypothetical protein
LHGLGYVKIMDGTTALRREPDVRNERLGTTNTTWFDQVMEGVKQRGKRWHEIVSVYLLEERRDGRLFTYRPL